MGERYDMDHVYYVDGRSWHGAAHYYEYPCVYIWVLVAEYIGLRLDLTADVFIKPCLSEFTSVRMEQQQWQLAYTWNAEGFTLCNLAAVQRSFRLDLSALSPGAEVWVAKSGARQTDLRAGDILQLEAAENQTITPKT